MKLVYVAPTATNMADASTNYITNPNDVIISNIRTKAESTEPDITVPLIANVAAKLFDEKVDFQKNHELTGYAKNYKK